MSIDFDVSDALISENPRRRKQAFQHLYKTEYGRIKAFVINNNGSDTEAQDIFQDGLVAFYSNLTSGKFNRAAKAETYLYSICKNLWLQNLRKLKKSDDFSMKVELNIETEPDKVVDSSLFYQIFRELKEDCQTVLIEFYYNNRSIEDLRKLLNMQSEQVVKNKKGRCLKYLMNIIRSKNLSKDSFFK